MKSVLFTIWRTFVMDKAKYIHIPIFAINFNWILPIY